jgi:hypothetical protein
VFISLATLNAFALGTVLFGEVEGKGAGDLRSIRPQRFKTCRFQDFVILENALPRNNFGPRKHE